MATVIVVLSRPLSNYCSLPSLNQLLFYVVPQASDKQSLILGVHPPGLNINSKPLVTILVYTYVSSYFYKTLGHSQQHHNSITSTSQQHRNNITTTSTSQQHQHNNIINITTTLQQHHNITVALHQY